MTTQRLPALPTLLDRKIYKTGQTRGADDDVIYQNRVSRTSTVLIPYACWDSCCTPQDAACIYENGFIVLLTPSEYFENPSINAELSAKKLAIGKNALVFYETREQWNTYNPEQLKWKAANSRKGQLGGQYVARISATTATANGGKIVRGFDSTSMKGAGIRVYEYASNETNKKCRLQLEALFWLCYDADIVAVNNGMTVENSSTRKATIVDRCRQQGLLDTQQLTAARILNLRGVTICPLCLEELSSQGFFNRMEQAEGRLVPDLTVTQLNLFHIDELRIGGLNHRPYNLGWGHHHCNVVVRDSGVQETVEWMKSVINRNAKEGYL
ncbi:MAG: BstXI family restriction endonuclease [Armatimonadetes bacterium]|nr:BstXI family restriction endonuclease [Armatimonadota bacterium]